MYLGPIDGFSTDRGRVDAQPTPHTAEQDGVLAKLPFIYCARDSGDFGGVVSTNKMRIEDVPGLLVQRAGALARKDPPLLAEVVHRSDRRASPSGGVKVKGWRAKIVDAVVEA